MASQLIWSGEASFWVSAAGMGEISAMLDRLSATSSSRMGKKWLIPLPSSISPAEQRQAFQIPPPGTRKIVLATNIAETSLTIPDVVFVVDAGKLKVCQLALALDNTCKQHQYASSSAGVTRTATVRFGKS